jgi:hypothetical protein
MNGRLSTCIANGEMLRAIAEPSGGGWIASSAVITDPERVYHLPGRNVPGTADPIPQDLKYM